jgi:hypothetical protein
MAIEVPEGNADDPTIAFLRNTGIKRVGGPVADGGARADDWQYKT